MLQTPYQLVVNKSDNKANDSNNFIFYNLGLGDPIFISAEHGRNIGERNAPRGRKRASQRQTRDYV